ncbi:MAG: BrnT family toxin [Myxococcota bacterium]|nr:BrnT family toxin [Myxococcota bacterium]
MEGGGKASFEWDDDKNRENVGKHGITFEEAQLAFFDPKRLIYEDITHSIDEQRYFCFGRVGKDIMTVRFTYRDEKIRIFGAGHWRKGRKIYGEINHGG